MWLVPLKKISEGEWPTGGYFLATRNGPKPRSAPPSIKGPGHTRTNRHRVPLHWWKCWRNIVRLSSWLIAGLLFLAPGCAVTGFGQFTEFQQYAGQRGYIRLPVIFIPGIKGSRLFLVDEANADREVKELWGTSSSVAVLHGFDDLLLDIRYKMGSPRSPGESYPDPEQYRPFNNKLQTRLGVRTGLLDSYRLGFNELVFAEFDIYGTMRRFLVDNKEGGYVLDRDLFFFSYDWRLDNRIAAVRLALELPRFRKEYMRLQAERFCTKSGFSQCGDEQRRLFDDYWKNVVQRDPRNKGLFNAAGDPKFIVVGHSMGGLVARYFVSGLGREDDVQRLLLLATPGFGAVDALKAFAKGEYPESLWTYLTKWFPLSPYSETDTKPILFSFASMFQLLPRHPRAVQNISLRELGLELNQSLTDFDSVASMPPARIGEGYLNRYEELSLVPSDRSVGRYLKGIDQATIRSYVREHLYANLRSSFCFHRAIRSNAMGTNPDERKILDDCQEGARIKLAERFIKQLDPTLASVSLGLRSEHIAPPVIVFAGHCHRTYYRARLVDKRLTYVIAPEETAELANEATAYEYGDDRVPLWSVGWDRPLDERNPGYTFFLCEDHVGLVKNPAFRYNLLRELQVIRAFE